MARTDGHFTEVALSGAAFTRVGVSPLDYPVTVQVGNVIRLGAACRKYLCDCFGIRGGPEQWPDPLPPEAEDALVRALACAERCNVASDKSGKSALVFSDDLAKVMGDTPSVINKRYRAAAARPEGCC